MNPALLDACYRRAENTEADARLLGSDWSGCSPVLALCESFRRACQSIAGNRGFGGTTVAFVGPKNAGKTHLLSLFVRNKERREQLRIGADAAHSTKRPTWVACSPPDGWRRDSEEFIPCAEEDLESLGFPYALLDVPGYDERHGDRKFAAIRALDDARMKVLVVGRGELEVAGWAEYLGRANGAVIIPAITKSRDLPESDVVDFMRNLREHLPESRVLEPVIIAHFDLEGSNRSAAIDAARSTLRERIVEAAAAGLYEAGVERELSVRERRFRQQVASLAAKHLPSTAASLKPLMGELGHLPERAAGALLGDERQIAANIRASIRAVLLERTPVFLFPWRLALSISNLVHGATDRLPLALAGSVPSLLTAGWKSAQNIRDGWQFRREIEEGLRRRVEANLKDEMRPRLEYLERALNHDIPRAESSAGSVAEKCSVRLVGLESLQSASTAIFQEAIGRAAPGRLTAWMLGLLGFAVFWIIFGQPIYGLYHDFAAAASDVIGDRAKTLAAFPAGTFSMLATSALLAVLPMGIILLVSIAIITRTRAVAACHSALREAHREKIRALTDGGILRAELSEPRLDACCRLLSESQPDTKAEVNAES